MWERTVRTGDGPDEWGELRSPDGPGPHHLVVLLHGGGWRADTDLAYMRPLAQDLCRRGYLTWLPEYRRVGEPGGGWPGTFRDVARAAAACRQVVAERDLAPGGVVLAGHSSGGHLALWLAARDRLPAQSPVAGGPPLTVRCVLAMAAPADLGRAWSRQAAEGRDPTVAGLMGGPPSAFPERYRDASPARLLPLGVPQIMVQGDRDEVAPLADAQAYCAAARAVGDRVRLLVAPGQDHMSVLSPDGEAWSQVVAALDELLAARP